MRHRALSLFTATGLAAVALTACGGDDAAGSVEEFCAMESRFDDIDTLDPTTEEGMAQMTEILQELEDAAPSEIKDDVAAVADAFTEIGGMTTEEMLEMDSADLEELMSNLETSGENVEAFVDANCG